MYLRVVHSFDYYSAVEYPNEDEMPHRCGIVHARTQIPPSRITQNDGTMSWHYTLIFTASLLSYQQALGEVCDCVNMLLLVYCEIYDTSRHFVKFMMV